MAVTIKPGDIIKAEGVHSGEGEKGPWFLCKLKAEKGRGSITIFNHDGFECADGDMIRITEIQSVSHNNRKWQDKWYEETNADCGLELAEDAVPDIGGEFDELPNDGELPF